jgi:hypothetical protein
LSVKRKAERSAAIHLLPSYPVHFWIQFQPMVIRSFKNQIYARLDFDWLLVNMRVKVTDRMIEICMEECVIAF